MCEQNFVGRPKRKQTEENLSKKICKICFQEIGRGIPHSCTKSNRDTVNSLVFAIENMDGNVKDRVVHKILQNEMTPLNKSASVSNAIELKTYGKSSRISLNPKLNIEKKSVNCDVLDKIRIQSGLSLSQTKVMTGDLRAFLGGASIAANYRDHASTSNNILDKFYFHDKQNFIIKSSLNESSKDVWVVWAPIGP